MTVLVQPYVLARRDVPDVHVIVAQTISMAAEDGSGRHDLSLALHFLRSDHSPVLTPLDDVVPANPRSALDRLDLLLTKGYRRISMSRLAERHSLVLEKTIASLARDHRLAGDIYLGEMDGLPPHPPAFDFTNAGARVGRVSVLLGVNDAEGCLRMALAYDDRSGSLFIRSGTVFNLPGPSLPGATVRAARSEFRTVDRFNPYTDMLGCRPANHLDVTRAAKAAILNEITNLLDRVPISGLGDLEAAVNVCLSRPVEGDVLHVRGKVVPLRGASPTAGPEIASAALLAGAVVMLKGKRALVVHSPGRSMSEFPNRVLVCAVGEHETDAQALDRVLPGDALDVAENEAAAQAERDLFQRVSRQLLAQGRTTVIARHSGEAPPPLRMTASFSSPATLTAAACLDIEEEDAPSPPGWTAEIGARFHRMGFTVSTVTGSAVWSGRMNGSPMSIREERHCLYGYSEVLIVEHAGRTRRIVNQEILDDVLREDCLSQTLKVG